MEKTRPKSFGNLIVEVIRKGMCASCAACVAVCPEKAIELEGEVPRIKGKCGVCQTCYSSCPQTFFEVGKVERQVFGRERSEEDRLGVMLEACFARSRDLEIAKAGQDGGAVTAILDSLIRADRIDCAVVSVWDRSRPWKPLPRVAVDHEGILAGAGTKYTPSATLIGLRDAVENAESGQIAVVGTPCQVRAIRKIQALDVAPVEMAPGKLFVVGLFCMESYGYESLIERYLPSKGVNPAEVTKFLIKKGRFIAQSGEDERINVPLKELRSNVRSACNLCRDFTAEFSDLSVGSVDAPVGWSTLIIRNDKGLDAVREAEKRGLIEIRKIEDPGEELRVTHVLSQRKSQNIEKISG